MIGAGLKIQSLKKSERSIRDPKFLLDLNATGGEAPASFIRHDDLLGISARSERQTLGLAAGAPASSG